MGTLIFGLKSGCEFKGLRPIPPTPLLSWERLGGFFVGLARVLRGSCGGLGRVPGGVLGGLKNFMIYLVIMYTL